MLQTSALSCKSLLGSHNIGDLRKNRKRTPFSWQILHGIFSLLVDSRQNMHFFMDWNRDQEGNYYIFWERKLIASPFRLVLWKKYIFLVVCRRRRLELTSHSIRRERKKDQKGNYFLYKIHSNAAQIRVRVVLGPGPGFDNAFPYFWNPTKYVWDVWMSHACFWW